MTAGPAGTVALTVIFFVTSLVTVVTGSTSLITIPVLMQFGVEPRTAVATNMLVLALLNFGGVLPFRGTATIDKRRAPLLIALTLAGSAVGALLLFAIPAEWMVLIIPVAMIAVLALLLFEPQVDAARDPVPSASRSAWGYSVMALLAIYGGCLSGGYATLVTAAGMLFFRYSFLRAMAMSKVLNVASSLIAVAVFAWYRIIDWRLGIILSVASFIGGFIGSHWAQKMPSKLLRRLFLLAVAVLAVKSLIFDVPWRDLMATYLGYCPRNNRTVGWYPQLQLQAR
jgi:uncharacterized protein